MIPANGTMRVARMGLVAWWLASGAAAMAAPAAVPARVPGAAGPAAVRKGGVAPGEATEPYLEFLLGEMKAWPVGQAVRERYRVVGVVRAVESGGVLLERASAREWSVAEVIADGGMTRKYGPGSALKLEGGYAFVAGLQAKVGQKVMADVQAAGTRDFVLGGLRTKVRVLKPGG